MSLIGNIYIKIIEKLVPEKMYPGNNYGTKDKAGRY